MAPVDLSEATTNWLKAVLALKHLKKGLLRFVDHQLSTYHNSLVTTHGACILCTIENVLPCPTRNACLRRGRICQFHDIPRNQHRPCPNGVCENIRDGIIREHFKGEPMWKNTDATKWSSDAWEVAKCFLPPGSKDAASSAGTDCTGILSLCLHCKALADLIDHHGVKNKFEKNRNNRNELMHSGSQELSDADRSSYIQDAVQLLSTFQTPVDRKTQDCIDTLNEIDSDGWLLTTDDIVDVMEDKVEAVRLKQEELEASLTKTDEAVAENTDELDAYKKRIRKLDNELRKVHSVIRNLKHIDVKRLGNKMETIRKKNEGMIMQIDALEIKVKEQDERLEQHDERHDGHDQQHRQHDKRLEEHGKQHKQHDARLEGHGTQHKQHDERFKEHDKQHKQHDKRLEEHDGRFNELERRIGEGSATKRSGSPTDQGPAPKRLCSSSKGLRDYLVKLYKKKYSDVLVAPPKLDMWADISKHYCEQNMKQVSMPGESHKGKGEEEVNIEVESYHDIFYRKGKHCRNIYIKGDAGSGKSVFCQHLVNRWCEIHSTAGAKDCESERDTISVKQKDIAMLYRFEFLFYITLRHATHLYDLESMIKQNILRNNKAMLDQLTYVLENESEKCLIVFDGLDEWSPPVGSTESPFVTSGLPDRDDSYDWTILTTTRPCQLETIRPKPCEMDQLIELSGLTEQSVTATITSVVGYLNNRYSKDRNAAKSPEECSEYLHKNISSHIMTLPIILKHLVCIWFEDGHVGKSRCEMYAAMVDLYLRYADLKASQNTLSHCNTATECHDLPASLRNREPCQRFKQSLFKLSKLAFQTLFNNDRSSSLVFESHTADMHGMTNSEVGMWLAIGLLSQDNVDTRSTKNEKMISFPHKTIQEFLAAVYMSMHMDPDTAVLPTVKAMCGSVDMVMEMCEVFVFLSGMAPTMVTTISRHISQVAYADGDIRRYRSTVTDKYSNETMRVKAIQQLMTHCIRESVDNGQTNTQVHIQDMIIENDRGYNNSVLSKLSMCNIKEWFKFNKSELVSVNVESQGWKQLKTVMGDMSKLAKIEINYGYDSDDNDDAVVISIITSNMNTLRAITLNRLSLKHATSKAFCIFQSLPCLRELRLDTVAFNLHQLERIQKLQALYLVDITCTHCSGPCRLDLSHLSQLQRLRIIHVSIDAVQINTSRLVDCQFGRPNSIMLKHKPKYVINSITFHGDGRLLQTVEFRCISIKHEQLEQILLFVKQSTRLREITLNEIKCSDSTAGCTWRLDLSQHTQLETLELQKLHVSEVQINTTQLMTCTIDSLRPAISAPNAPVSEEISLMFHGDGSQLWYLTLTNIVMKHEQFERLMLFVTRATRLCQIILSDIRCSECSTVCTWRLDLSQHTQLEALKLQKVHVSEVQINTTQLEMCIIDSLRPTSSAPNEPGYEEISLMFHGDGSQLFNLALTNIVLKHEQLEQLMLFLTRATGSDSVLTELIAKIKCSDCGSDPPAECSIIKELFSLTESIKLNESEIRSRLTHRFLKQAKNVTRRLRLGPH